MNPSCKMLAISSIVLFNLSCAMTTSLLPAVKRAINVRAHERASELTDEIFTVLAHRAKKQPLEPVDDCLLLSLRATSLPEFYHKRNLRVAALLYRYGSYFDTPVTTGSLLEHMGFSRDVVVPIKLQPYLAGYLAKTVGEEDRNYYMTVHPDAVSLAEGLRRAERTLSGFKAPLEAREDDVYQELLNGLRERE